MQVQVGTMELWKYLKKEGSFGKQMAALGCSKNDDNFDPGINILRFILDLFNILINN